MQPGKAEEQINLFKKLQPLVLNEKGCMEYKLSNVAGSDVEFVITERWASSEDSPDAYAMPLYTQSPLYKQCLIWRHFKSNGV